MHTDVIQLAPVDWRNVVITGGFWGARQETNRTVTLPLEYRICENTGRLDAYQWDDDAERVWNLWVGDVGKWIEAASYSIAQYPDPQLSRLLDDAIDRLLRGQKADGYLHCIQTPPAQRYTHLLFEHELYDAGHTMEAAVAHYLATGERRLLEAMCRNADHLDAVFGPEEGKHRGYDGHEEVELALVRLYRATGEARYLRLARHFIDIRGAEPHYFREELLARGENPDAHWINASTPHAPFLYLQAHRPVREQEDADGHAVRALYLYCGMADVAVETGDAALLDACRKLWRSITQRRMYITGGVGSSREGERFTVDYDLPNETAYAETCAAIALVFFAHRMLQIDADAEYADVMERALYNGVLSGMSLDGTRFFYANPLTVFPPVSAGNPGNIAPVRQEWFGTSCCPPNIARLIASLGQYVYSLGAQDLFVHLYVQGMATVKCGGVPVLVTQTTRYPWEETVRMEVAPEQPVAFTLALRIPGWCRAAAIAINGEAVQPVMTKGYARLSRTWQAGDVVEITFPMPVERVEAHPQVRMDAGKVALQRGPLVYCLEEVDNGAMLADLSLPETAALTAAYDPALLGGTVVLRGKALRRKRDGWDDALYRSEPSTMEEVDLVAVPYCLWANRAAGEMLVWIRRG